MRDRGSGVFQVGDAILERDRWLAVDKVKKICLEADGMCGLEGLEPCDCREALCICSGDEQVGSVAVVVEDPELDRDAGDLDCGGREARCLAVTVADAPFCDIF